MFQVPPVVFHDPSHSLFPDRSGVAPHRPDTNEFGRFIVVPLIFSPSLSLSLLSLPLPFPFLRPLPLLCLFVSFHLCSLPLTCAVRAVSSPVPSHRVSDPFDVCLLPLSS